MGQLHKLDTSVVVQAAAYGANDLFGGKLSFAIPQAFPRVAQGYIVQAILCDLVAQNIAHDLVIFDADPTGTTFTENSPLDVADTDLAKVAGLISFIASVGNVAFADNSLRLGGLLNVAAGINELRIPFIASSGILYGALITRGTPTFASVADVTLRLMVELNDH